MTEMTEWGAPKWATLDDGINALSDLLDDVIWHQPLTEAQTASIQACAAWVRDRTDELTHPLIEDIAAISALDAMLHWVCDPQDDARINRVHRAFEAYWTICDLVDES
jgi:hypothetical protein